MSGRRATMPSMNPRQQKLDEYLAEELEADEYNNDVDTVLPDYEAEELGGGDASTADRESQREAQARALKRAHEYAKKKAMDRTQDRVDAER